MGSFIVAHCLEPPANEGLSPRSAGMSSADATANATVAVQGLALVQLDVSSLGRHTWGMIAVDNACSRGVFIGVGCLDFRAGEWRPRGRLPLPHQTRSELQRRTGHSAAPRGSSKLDRGGIEDPVAISIRSPDDGGLF